MTGEKPDVPSEGTTILVIPDSHSEPDQDLTRYTLLGRMICDVFANVSSKCIVVQIGDWYDLASMSSYERPGSKSFEGRRFMDDLDAGMEAQRLVWKEVEDYNRWRRGENVLDIEWHWLQGNHEQRLAKALEADPTKLEGVISMAMLTEDSPIPWTVHDFLRPLFINEVGFCHYWASGVMGRGIGGENPAATILRKQMTSCVQGHTHTLDYAERTRADGVKLSAAVVGCYFTDFVSWAGYQVNQLWTPGVAVLRDVNGGQFDFEWWSYRRIVKSFGD
jgi:hypothetical protein